MYAVVGLGNVGKKYEQTRHNAGFMFVDRLINSSEDKNIIFLKPDTMMNASGKAVSKLVNFYKIGLNNLYVVHDDLDLKLGEFKLQFGVGPKVHNGVNSVVESLGSDEFWRIRIGVDNRGPENRIPGEAYVLQNFSGEERKIVNEVIEKACRELTNVILEAGGR
jgi:PTH1 family peptidyl-tRNA hydrolase